MCLGGSFSAVSGDPWSLYHNPAGLASIDHFQSALFFIPQQFGLSELRTVSFAVAFPLPPVAFGVGVDQFGFDLYKETAASLALGKEIGSGVCAGIAFHYERISIRGYGSTGIVLVDAGVGAKPLEEWCFGFFARNVTGERVGARKERLPRTVTLGTGYSPFLDFLLTLEVEKDVRYPASMKAGVEQRVFEFAVLRCGISTRPDVVSLGFELAFADLVFGYAAASHPELGWTQSVELQLRLRP